MSEEHWTYPPFSAYKVQGHRVFNNCTGFGLFMQELLQNRFNNKRYIVVSCDCFSFVAVVVVIVVVIVVVFVVVVVDPRNLPLKFG